MQKKKCIFFPTACGMFTKIDHALHHNPNFKVVNSNRIKLFSDHTKIYRKIV